MDLFIDVFKNIKLNPEATKLFSNVSVQYIKTNSRGELVIVHIESDHLIPKRVIYQVEKAIRNEYFHEKETMVVIEEHYHLSDLYTPKTLWDVYQDSIYEELNHISSFSYSLLMKAEIKFLSEDEMMIVLPDSPIALRKEAELRGFLQNVFMERSNLAVKLNFAYEELEEDTYRKEAEHKLEVMVEELSRRVNSAGEHESNDDEIATYGTSSSDNKDGGSGAGASGQAGGGTKEGDGAGKTGSTKKASDGAGQTGSKDTKKSDSTKGDFKKGDFKKGEFKKGDRKFGNKEGSTYLRALRKSDNPDVLYGKEFLGDATPINEIVDEIGEVVIKGKIFSSEDRPIKGEKHLFIFYITDFTDSIAFKIFIYEEQVKEFTDLVKVGEFVKLKGVAAYDSFSKEISISNVQGIYKIGNFTTKRMDYALKKRVELHCHTKSSDMDGVSYAKDIIKRADSWGWDAIAITDHGVVQAFPEAMHTTDDMKGREKPFKVLYGVEGYLVDDLTQAAVNEKGQKLRDSFVVFDIETTGFSPVDNRIIEIGAVRVSDGVIKDKFSAFVNPKTPIPFEIQNLTHITDNMVIGEPEIDVILPKFLEFIGDDALVAHNANFDMSFIMENCKRLGIEKEFTYVDTVAISRSLITKLTKHNLDALVKELGIQLSNHHRAVDDAQATAEIFERFVKMLENKGITTLKELNELTSSSVDRIMKSPSYHVIILAKNETGRMNLYRLVSESHCTYFHRHPRMPKSLIEKYREGLIVGSACEAGELFRAILDKKTDEYLTKIAEFYDYLEIQPVGNNEFMIRSDRHPDINTIEDLQNLNRKVVEIGDRLHKPVCATCDVHFLDPEDEVYRRILMSCKGFDDADEQAPLFLRTTEEMLEEFAYLGDEKAKEVVITNTNLIADMCEIVSPIHPDKCAPVIPNSDVMLREICETKAHEIYGETLPPVVEERLERELNSIISNGFAVMYIIAQKLVWKSNEDGYLVGSRGSVGSSFVATMAGITEVNPLPPHYYCSKCHYSDFDSEEVKAYALAGKAGCDMEDKNCPVCGEKLKKDGFDIPFETFLGFKGDKEPDIDLNFSGEYQSKAHKYTEVIFGAGQTFRAGTVGTVAEKTACGYVRKYYEEHGIPKRNCEITRIAQGCIDVRRTTGQHPGGIIVLPIGYDINQFTPVQHPANDMKTDIITTHFDYHSIDHNLLKLDILGHDDPTMIRMLQDLTGIDPLKIPLDDPQVMTLFQDTSALGITPEQIGGTRLGSLGIPEFGTDFAMQMLIDTHPTSFSDLVRIAGLAHGTDVWLGNAQKLIAEGTATISTAICTRDDIMTYLIGMGLDPGESFQIMENVRKGKVAKGKCKDWPAWKEDMIAHGVPDWYVWSCEMIKYMFPKAHAAAYVMMAWRIAYCKVNYPLAYYAAYFSIRATAFDYEKMCLGPERLNHEIAEYRKKAGLTDSGNDKNAKKDDAEEVSNKEEGEYKDMRLVQEMYARGFEFLPIDIFKADAKNFQIIDGKIMPSLISISGVAETAAQGIVEACKMGPFTSKMDFKNRAKVSGVVVETMYRLGLLGVLPENNQISLFDSI